MPLSRDPIKRARQLKNLEAGMAHPGDVHNPNGRPRKTITKLIEQFEKEGMTMPSPHEIAKIYFYTAARTEGELKEMLQDKELPMMTRIIAKGVLDKRGLDVLEKIIDRAYGKEQRIDLTTNGKDLKPEPLVLKIVANKDEWEKISNEIPNIEDNEKK